MSTSGAGTGTRGRTLFVCLCRTSMMEEDKGICGVVVDSTGRGCESDALDRGPTASHRQLTVVGVNIILLVCTEMGVSRSEFFRNYRNRAGGGCRLK